MQSKKVKDRRQARLNKRLLPSWQRRAFQARLNQLRRLRTLDFSHNPGTIEIQVSTKHRTGEVARIRQEIQILTLLQFGKVSKREFIQTYPNIVLL